MLSCFRISVIFVLVAMFIPLIFKYKDQREYNNRTTAKDALGNVNLNGKTIIVTGSNTGIGKTTVQVLLSHGAQVIMACRNKRKAINASKDIINTILSSKDCASNIFCDQHKLEDNLDVIILDLASLDSIDSFSKQFINKYEKLNYLILNAGTPGLWYEWSATNDGIESVFGINHIGHYYLTMKLTTVLIHSANKQQISRVISVSSAAHHWSPLNITQWLINNDKIQNPKEYGYINYGFSKACNILFAKEFNDRFSKKNVFAVSLHPGTIWTEFSRNRPWLIRMLMKHIGSNFFMKSWSQGAATTVRTVALTDKEFIKYGGSYFSDCNVANNELRSDLFPEKDHQKNKPQSLLWNLSNNILVENGKKIDFEFK